MNFRYQVGITIAKKNVEEVYLPYAPNMPLAQFLSSERIIKLKEVIIK